MAWKTARICPEKVDVPNEELSFNLVTIPVSLGIFIMARRGIAGAPSGISNDVILPIISALIAFFTGFIYYLVCPGPQASENSKKWGTFFVITWLISLLLSVIFDAFPFWTTGERITTAFFNTVFGPDSIDIDVRDLIRCIFFSAISLSLLILKTIIMDRDFRFLSRCALVTCAIGLSVNTALLELFLYRHVM